MIIFIIFGCLLVNQADGWSDSHRIGIGLAALAGVCYGFFSIFGEKICQQYASPCLLFWQFTFAGIATTVFYCFFPNYHAVFGQLLQMVTAPTPAIWIPALGLGLLATFLPYLFYGHGLKLGLKSTTASALTLLESISTTILAWVFLHQSLNSYQLVGCALVVIASLHLSKIRANK